MRPEASVGSDVNRGVLVRDVVGLVIGLRLGVSTLFCVALLAGGGSDDAPIATGPSELAPVKELTER